MPAAPAGRVLYKSSVCAADRDLTRAGREDRLPSEWVARGRNSRPPELPQDIHDQHRHSTRQRPVGRPAAAATPLAPEAYLFAQQLLRQAKAQAPVLVIGLATVDGRVALASAGLPLVRARALRRL